MSFWWCTDHNAVEGDGSCRAEVRLGPYLTADAAQHALQSVKERNDRVGAEDEAYENG